MFPASSQKGVITSPISVLILIISNNQQIFNRLLSLELIESLKTNLLCFSQCQLSSKQHLRNLGSFCGPPKKPLKAEQS